jgi:FkbM family methyltransferase
MWSMNRRDFVLGNLSGLCVGAASAFAASRFTNKGLGPGGTSAAPSASASAATSASADLPLARLRPLATANASASATEAPGDPDLRDAHTSFAQNGEDLILRQAVHDTCKVAKPEYMDIGAWDPIKGNNTYLFYREGSRGVLVEPNPGFCDKLEKVRTGDVVVRAGIRGQGFPEESDYYMFGDSQLNTFDKEVAKARGGGNVVKMPLLDINKVMADHFKAPPALLSIDAEGMDLSILKTLDFVAWRPKVIIAEAWSGKNGGNFDADIMSFVAAKGFVFRGGTMVNAVFVDKKLLGA